MSDWIPRPNAEALRVMIAFKTGIAAQPSVYAVAQPEVDTIVRVVDEFEEARRIALAPATRTKPAIDRMYAKRVSAEQVCRHYYGMIKRNLGISNAAKTAICVRPINNTRTKRECPQTSPSLTIEAATPLGLTLHYRDSTNMQPRAKPANATMVQLFMKIADGNATDPEDLEFVGNYTSNPMTVIFDPAHRGKQATFFARWGGRRNQFGKWSLPVSMTVAACARLSELRLNEVTKRALKLQRPLRVLHPLRGEVSLADLAFTPRWRHVQCHQFIRFDKTFARMRAAPWGMFARIRRGRVSRLAVFAGRGWR